jgi:hypothetical protein
MTETPKKRHNREQADVSRKNEELAMAWIDKCTAMILTTFHSGSKNEVTEVPSKYSNKPPIQKPNVALEYTKCMRGVNRSDHYTVSYKFMGMIKKWCVKIFLWLLEVCIVNSYLLYVLVQEQYSKRPLTHMKFTKSPVHERMTTSKRMQKAK